MAIYLGSTEMTPDMLSGVKAVYLGSSLVWEKHLGTKNPSLGEYILDTDGYFHTYDEWVGGMNELYTPDCIAFIGSSFRFGCALTDNGTQMRWSTMDDHTVNNVLLTNVKSEAILDYSGINNTNEILSQHNAGEATAAEYCRSVISRRGEKGYLGACGEMYTMSIQGYYGLFNIFAAAGGEAPESYYWTSTLYYKGTRVWRADFIDKGASGAYKYEKLHARALFQV